MPTCSEAKTALKSKIPRPCAPKPAVKLPRKINSPKKNISPTSKPQHSSTFIHAVMTTPRKSRNTSGQQASIIASEPAETQNDEMQTWRCFQCRPTKDLESSLSLMYHKKYQHDNDFSCPVEGCNRKDFKTWKSLLTNHIRIQHEELLRDLHKAKNDYNHQPFYEKLDRVDREF